MQKAMESRMLLEMSGAEKLLGIGDLLFRDIGARAICRASGSRQRIRAKRQSVRRSADDLPSLFQLGPAVSRS